MPARASSELQRREAEEHEHHGDDPKAHHHLALLPALELVVMMQRRHAENALAAGGLEAEDLQHHGERLADEHAAHVEEHNLLPANNGNLPARPAMNDRADAAHEHPG